jgi:hypothetical protein
MKLNKNLWKAMINGVIVLKILHHQRQQLHTTNPSSTKELCDCTHLMSLIVMSHNNVLMMQKMGRIALVTLTYTGKKQTQTNFQYQKFQGPKHTLSANSTPLTYLYLFFSITFLNSTATEINRYAHKFLHIHTNLS